MTIPHYDNQPQNTQLSICPNCGHEVEDWAFCFYCGTNLKPQSVTEQSIDEVEPSETKTDNATLEEIEAQQQEPEVNVPSCPNCGKEIGDWDFCFHCGANLKAESIGELYIEENDQPESEPNNTLNITIEEKPEETEVETTVCPNCGKEIGEWDFCFHCGTNLKARPIAEKPDEKEEQPEFAQEINPEASTNAKQDDLEVKTPMCPNCGKEIGDWDFCFHCGTNLKNIIIPEVSGIDTNNQLIETDPTLEKNSESERNSDPNDISDTKANEPESTDTDERIIILEDENGNEIEYIFLDLIQYRDKEYVVLLPNDDSVELVTILQFEETSDGIEHYTSVENNFTLQVVFEIFKERAKNEFNFID